jgi:hypothetical protein
MQIAEILETGKLRKAEVKDEMTKTLTLFLKIWGASKNKQTANVTH